MSAAAATAEAGPQEQAAKQSAGEEVARWISMLLTLVIALVDFWLSSAFSTKTLRSDNSIIPDGVFKRLPDADGKSTTRFRFLKSVVCIELMLQLALS